MSLQGLPDFQKPLQIDGGTLFYPYEGAGGPILLPDCLELATDDNGKPDFALELVRGPHPNQPPVPYGLLNFSVSPRYQTTTALKYVSTHHLGNTLRQAQFSSSGFLRFQLMGSLSQLPEPLLAPTTLAWNGLGNARCLLKLSDQESALLQEVLQQGELLALSGAAEQELMGVSPRLPYKVYFNPAELLEALTALGHPQGQIARQTIKHYFRDNLDSLPIEIIGGSSPLNKDDFAEAMTDRVRVRFGTFTPAPTIKSSPCMTLISPEHIGSGQFEWDLSQPLQAPRPVLLPLKRFDAAQQIIQAQGTDAVIHHTTVPNIPIDFQRVAVVANLPKHPKGILDWGVTIRVNSKLPYRPQAQVHTVRLEDSQDNLTVDLRFSPRETPEYTYFTYVVVHSSGGIQQFTGETKTQKGAQLYLSPDDFPMTFLPIKATPSLLNIADIRGVISHSDNERDFEESFTLTLDQPQITWILPQNVDDATLSIEARSHQGLGSLVLEPMSVNALQLGLYSFREAGPQNIDVECMFESHTKPVLFEFLPEGLLETSKNIQLLSFTPNQAMQRLTWLPQSPFQYRYRYRRKPLVSDTKPAEKWSAYLSPFNPLKIHV